MHILSVIFLLLFYSERVKTIIVINNDTQNYLKKQQLIQKINAIAFKFFKKSIVKFRYFAKIIPI